MVENRRMRYRLGKVAKEAAMLLLTVFIFSNIISWLRAPKLESEALTLKEATLIDGGRWRYEAGKPLVVHFWATWCRVCRAEAANIDSVAKRYNVVTVAVKSGTKEEVADFLKAHHLRFDVINDPHGVLAQRFGVTVFPTTFIFDANGTLKFTEVGYTTTAGLLARLGVAHTFE